MVARLCFSLGAAKKFGVCGTPTQFPHQCHRKPNLSFGSNSNVWENGRHSNRMFRREIRKFSLSIEGYHRAGSLRSELKGLIISSCQMRTRYLLDRSILPSFLGAPSSAWTQYVLRLQDHHRSDRTASTSGRPGLLH